MTHKVSTLPWFLQKITAIFLAVGLLIHFWILHFGLESSGGEGKILFSKLADRLRSPGWIAFDILLLAAAIYHGLNGIWAIIRDLNPPPKAQSVIKWFLALLGLFSFIFGIYVAKIFMIYAD